jgi:hypothetical protein
MDTSLAWLLLAKYTPQRDGSDRGQKLFAITRRVNIAGGLLAAALTCYHDRTAPEMRVPTT